MLKGVVRIVATGGRCAPSVTIVVIPIVATGGRCDIGGVIPVVATGGRCIFEGVIPVVATGGGAVTDIVSIGVSFLLWPLGGAGSHLLLLLAM